MTDSSSTDWQAESLRHTSFLLQPVEPTEKNFWELLVGKQPDQRISRANERLTIEEGPFSTGRLHVELRSDRIDWRFTFDQNSSPANLPTIGSYEEVRGDFQDLLKGWPSVCPPTNRIAYGAILILPVADLSTANNLIQGMMPMNRFNIANATDFLFRINRRRNIQSRAGELSINRISTWSVANVSRILVDLSSSDRAKISTSDDVCVCRLELDINTVPTPNVELDNDSLEDVFNTLVAFADEIAAQGDTS